MQDLKWTINDRTFWEIVWEHITVISTIYSNVTNYRWCRSVPSVLLGVCAAMYAGKWAEAEPGQDGGPEGGWPHHQQSGKLTFGGHDSYCKEWGSQLGDPPGPGAHHGNSGGVSGPYRLFFHLWQIAQLRPYLDVGALTTLVHELVILRLDHCNALYMGLPLRLMRKLQMVQNAVARLLSGVRKYHHISPTLPMLHWLPIQFHIEFKVLMLTYKALNGLGPRYLTERLLHQDLPVSLTQARR